MKEQLLKNTHKYEPNVEVSLKIDAIPISFAAPLRLFEKVQLLKIITLFIFTTLGTAPKNSKIGRPPKKASICEN